MAQTIRQTIADEIVEFKLPRYESIPNVGLYLEQTVNYIADYLEPLRETEITSSMVSNYVKKKLVSNPVHKQYNREQIATLIFIAVTKSVLSLDSVRVLLNIRQNNYSAEIAYNSFCEELENSIKHVFGLLQKSGSVKNADDAERARKNEEQNILRSTTVAVAHKVYLDQWIGKYATSQEE
ncbi:MAG: DUF1836 domain-containing protein [Lachnospiraceae bacterium]|nr:DUF1836 domain-containing protein [Lachnospiraceae bacterium]